MVRISSSLLSCLRKYSRYWMDLNVNPLVAHNFDFANSPQVALWLLSTFRRKCIFYIYTYAIFCHFIELVGRLLPILKLESFEIRLNFTFRFVLCVCSLRVACIYGGLFINFMY